MKKTILIILAFIPLGLSAQTIERQVLGSNGALTVLSNIRANYTIGEPVVTNFISTNLIVNQGFQQNYNVGDGINEIDSDFSINAYPNPTDNKIILEFSSPSEIKLTVALIDELGRVLLSNNYIASSSTSHEIIDMKQLAAANYFFTFKNSNGELLKTIKVQKVN